MSAMDEADIRYNAEQAKAVLENSFIKSVWDKVERRYTEAALNIDASDDERRGYAQRVKALRDVRAELESAVTRVKDMDRQKPVGLP